MFKIGNVEVVYEPHASLLDADRLRVYGTAKSVWELGKVSMDLEKAKREGILECISELRKLQEIRYHQVIWNHSRDSFFAPVELSDYILNKLVHGTQK